MLPLTVSVLAVLLACHPGAGAAASPGRPAPAQVAANPGQTASSSPVNASVVTLAATPGSGWFHHVAVDDPEAPKSVYAADSSQHVIRRLDLASGSIEVLAGHEGQPGFANGPATEALFHRPTSLCKMPNGLLAIADAGNACVRSLDLKTGQVSTLAGGCGLLPGYADGPADTARFGSGVKSIVCLADCSVLVGDVGIGRLRMIQVEGPHCHKQPHRRSPTLPAALRWVLISFGGLAVLLAVLLAGYAVQRYAAEAVRRMRQARAVHALEAGVAQGLRTRRDHRAAGWAGLEGDNGAAEPLLVDFQDEQPSVAQHSTAQRSVEPVVVAAGLDELAADLAGNRHGDLAGSAELVAPAVATGLQGPAPGTMPAAPESGAGGQPLPGGQEATGGAASYIMAPFHDLNPVRGG